MIKANGIADGIYGPVPILVQLRVENGVVTLVESDVYDYTLHVETRGQSRLFFYRSEPTGKPPGEQIKPLPTPR